MSSMQGIRGALGGALLTLAIAPAGAWATERQAYAAGLTFPTAVVAAAPGDTLRFDNADVTSHDLASDTPGLFRSPVVAAGQDAVVDGVDKLPPGSYPFHCNLHPWMHGVLEVDGSAASVPAVPAPPSVDPSNPPNPLDLVPHVAPAPLTAGDWPSYGHDLANTRDGGAGGPAAADVPFLRPVWSMKSSDGDFTGTPVVSGGTLVAAAGHGTVFALDASTGALRWKTDLIPDGDIEQTINATPAIAGGRVYVPISKANGPQVAALDLADGSVVWRTTYDTQQGADTFGSPVVWDGRVYIGTSGQNGDPDVPLRGAITALDAATGDQVFKTFTVAPGHNGGPVWSTPAIDADTGILYAGTGNAYSGEADANTDAVISVDARTGALLRVFQATAGDVFTTSSPTGAVSPDFDFGASPNLFTDASGRKLVGEGQKSGIYWGLTRDTLTPAWMTPTGGGSAVGGIIGSTAWDGKRLYGPNSIGGVNWALNPDGTPAWATTTGGPIHWNPVAVANGVVYTADMNGTLTAMDASTGLPLVKLPLGGQSYGGVSVAGGYVFAATGTQSAGGYVVGYRVDSGAVSRARRLR